MFLSTSVLSDGIRLNLSRLDDGMFSMANLRSLFFLAEIRDCMLLGRLHNDTLPVG